MNEKGLYHKYTVTRTDGRDKKGEKHYGCAYFVLDLTHDEHAIPALQAYATSVEAENPQLAIELRNFIWELSK